MTYDKTCQVFGNLAGLLADEEMLGACSSNVSTSLAWWVSGQEAMCYAPEGQL